MGCLLPAGTVVFQGVTAIGEGYSELENLVVKALPLGTVTGAVAHGCCTISVVNPGPLEGDFFLSELLLFHVSCLGGAVLSDSEAPAPKEVCHCTARNKQTLECFTKPQPPRCGTSKSAYAALIYHHRTHTAPHGLPPRNALCTVCPRSCVCCLYCS